MSALFSTDSIVTAPFRLSFPEVFVPTAFSEQSAKKYSLVMMIPKDGIDLIPAMPGTGSLMLTLRKLLFEAIKGAWGADKAKWPVNLRNIDLATYLSPTGKDGWPLRDGDLSESGHYSGHFYVRATSQNRPGVVDAGVHAVINPEDVFGGLIVRAQVNAYAYDNAGNKGVTIGLNNMQILKDDGTRFGGNQDPAKVFDAFGGGQADVFGATGTDDPFA